MFGGGQQAVKRSSLNFRALVTSQAAKPQHRPRAGPREVQLSAPQHQVFIFLFGPNYAKQKVTIFRTYFCLDMQKLRFHPATLQRCVQALNGKLWTVWSRARKGAGSPQTLWVRSRTGAGHLQALEVMDQTGTGTPNPMGQGQDHCKP